MRLTNKQIDIIKVNFQSCFEGNASLWLFGSRADDSQKGGDIDLYVETNADDPAILYQQKLDLIVKLKMALGDQKIDIVINNLAEQKQLPIYDEAKSKGVKLI